MRRLTIAGLLFVAIAVTGPSAEAAWDDMLPGKSRVIEGYEVRDSVVSRLSHHPLGHIEGLWQVGADQAVIAIERCADPAVALQSSEIYQLIIVDSPRPSIAPGTILGYAAPSGRPDTYDARIYTSSLRSLLGKQAKFTLTLNADDTHISIIPAKKKWRILLRQTFSFLTRVGFYADPSATREIDGLTRIFPPSTGKPARPIYL